MYKKGSRLYFVGIAVGVLVGVLLPAQSVLAAASSITTSPATLNLQISPGSSHTSTLQILNSGSMGQSINVELQTFGPYGQQGSAAIQPFPKNDPSASYVHFSQTSFVAQPGAWKSITMTISLPPSAQLGYYYAVIFKPTISQPNSQNLNIFKASNAILVLVDTNSSNEQRLLSLVSFTSSKKLYDYLPATFNIDIHNRGNIYLAPRGQVFIARDSKFRNLIASMVVNAGQGNILPRSNRSFSVQWQDGFPVYTPKMINGHVVTDASGQVVQQLKWDFSQAHRFRFGKYYAHLVLAYNNGKRDVPIESSLSFWVIPWVTLLIALVIALILVAGVGLIVWTLLKGGRSALSSSKRQKSYHR